MLMHVFSNKKQYNIGASTNRLLALKNYCQDLLNTHSEKSAMKWCGHGHFYA